MIYFHSILVVARSAPVSNSNEILLKNDTHWPVPLELYQYPSNGRMCLCVCVRVCWLLLVEWSHSEIKFLKTEKVEPEVRNNIIIIIFIIRT